MVKAAAPGQPGVGDGDAMGVTAKVFEHFLRLAISPHNFSWNEGARKRTVVKNDRWNIRQCSVLR